MQPPYDPNANSQPNPNAPYPNAPAGQPSGEMPPNFNSQPGQYAGQPQGQPAYPPQDQGPYSGQPQGQPAYPPQNPNYPPNPYAPNPYAQGPVPMSTQPTATVPRKKSPLKTVAIVGGVGLLGLIGLGALVGDDKDKGTGSTPGTSVAYASPEFQKYLGKWTGSDGTTMWIRGDGKGDFNAGSVKVSGGGVTLDEKAQTLAITSFLNVGKTWKISEPSDGSTMTLDNMVFRRTDGGASSGTVATNDDDAPSSTSEANSSEVSTSESGESSESTTSGGSFAAGEVPPESEQKRLVLESLTVFDNALASRDFSDLYAYSAKMWQDQTNADELKTAFKPFWSQNVRLNGVLRLSKPVWTSDAEIDSSNILRLRGYYPAGRRRLVFELGYLNEDEQWKLAVLNVKTADAPE